MPEGKAAHLGACQQPGAGTDPLEGSPVTLLSGAAVNLHLVPKPRRVAAYAIPCLAHHRQYIPPDPPQSETVMFPGFVVYNGHDIRTIASAG